MFGIKAYTDIKLVMNNITHQMIVQIKSYEIIIKNLNNSGIIKVHMNFIVLHLFKRWSL